MKDFKLCKGCRTKAMCTKMGKCMAKEKASQKEGLAGKMTAATTSGKDY